MAAGFSEEDIERYSRHIILAEVGGRGQQALLGASAFVVGAGGLGSPALLYLAAAGIGRIGVADGDVVELSNLQRQIIHGTSDVGKSKALSAGEAIKEINPHCEVEVRTERLTAGNVREALRGYDVVLDGCDNFPTRFLVSDACWLENIPLVSAAVVRFEGQMMTILPGESPCYRCYLPEPPPPDLAPNCQQAGVLGPVVGTMGTLQAVEALKVLLGLEPILSHKLMIYDALEGDFRNVKRGKDPECALCGPTATITEPSEYAEVCAAVSRTE